MLNDAILLAIVIEISVNKDHNSLTVFLCNFIDLPPNIISILLVISKQELVIFCEYSLSIR